MDFISRFGAEASKMKFKLFHSQKNILLEVGSYFVNKALN